MTFRTLTLETDSFQFLYGGQFTLPTQLINPKFSTSYNIEGKITDCWLVETGGIFS